MRISLSAKSLISLSILKKWPSRSPSNLRKWSIFYVIDRHFAFFFGKIVVKADFTLKKSHPSSYYGTTPLHSQVADQFNRSAGESSAALSQNINSPREEDTMVEYPLGKVILDCQIVDTYGKKVVRVNDIEFVMPEINFDYPCHWIVAWLPPWPWKMGRSRDTHLLSKLSVFEKGSPH